MSNQYVILLIKAKENQVVDIFAGTLHERGFTSRKQEVGDTFFVVTENETYDLHFLRKVLQTFPCLGRLPFIQTYKME